MDLKQRASLFAIGSAFILAGGKFGVGLNSGSMAVASSGLDSLLDVFMSAMNFLAIRKAAQPPDSRHPYGHGKAESLAAVIQAGVIMFTGAIIIYKAAEKYFLEAVIHYSGLDLGIMVLSLVFYFTISRVLRKVGEKTGSDALKADALHYASDLYSNTAAIAAIILTHYTGLVSFDLLFAVVVGLIILFSAVQILRAGLVGLMDSRIPEPLENILKDILETQHYPAVGYHKLRTRLSGSKKYIDFHSQVCRKLTVGEAHELIDKLEQDIKNNITPLDITIHIEPCPYTCDLDETTCEIVNKPKNNQV
jgi:cation diffusion facilitator family transporter